jgi:integrase
MTQQQAAKVLRTASGLATTYVKVVKAANGRYAATHGATTDNELACGNKPPRTATITEVSQEIKETTCRSRRARLDLDEAGDVSNRLEALFVVSIALGVRPGELRKLTWDHVDLRNGVIHVWKSASKSGDTKTPQSKRWLELPKRAVKALKEHQQRQHRERQEAGGAWHENNLVFCHENGGPTPATASTGASAR